MGRLLHRLLPIALAASTAAAWSAPPPLSDRDAVRLVEGFFDPYSEVTIPTGRFSVVSDQSDCFWERGVICRRNLAWVRAAERAGVVTVELDKGFEGHKSGQDFSWDNFYQQSQRGVISKVTVKPKPDISVKRDKANPLWLRLPFGKWTNIRIVSNEKKPCGIEECRLLLVTYDADWDPIAQHHGAITKRKYEKQRKGALLVQWDAFANKWKEIHGAYSNASEDLDTSDIAAFLARGR